MDRSGEVAVVTGSSRGLGAGMARAFAARGMTVALCARTRPELPEGVTGLSASVDVSDPDAVERFARQVADRFGRIDLWVNNAGVVDPVGPLADAEPEALRRSIEVNVLGVLYGSRVFARQVRAQPGRGVLVNITSGAAVKPYEGWAAYCASKAAVDMITQVVGLEESRHGLAAYAVAPGVVDTDMQAVVRAAPVDAFPSVGRFLRLKEEEAFNTPEWVADHILDHCMDGPPAGSATTGAAVFRVPDQPRPQSGGAGLTRPT